MKGKAPSLAARGQAIEAEDPTLRDSKPNPLTYRLPGPQHLFESFGDEVASFMKVGQGGAPCLRRKPQATYAPTQRPATWRQAASFKGQEAGAGEHG